MDSNQSQPKRKYYRKLAFIFPAVYTVVTISLLVLEFTPLNACAPPSGGWFSFCVGFVTLASQLFTFIPFSLTAFIATLLGNRLDLYSELEFGAIRSPIIIPALILAVLVLALVGYYADRLRGKTKYESRLLSKKYLVIPVVLFLVAIEWGIYKTNCVYEPRGGQDDYKDIQWELTPIKNRCAKLHLPFKIVGRLYYFTESNNYANDGAECKKIVQEISPQGKCHYKFTLYDRCDIDCE